MAEGTRVTPVSAGLLVAALIVVAVLLVAVVFIAIAWAANRRELLLEREARAELAISSAGNGRELLLEREVRAELEQYRDTHPYTAASLEKALAGSRNSIGGTAGEQMAPFLSGYPHDAREVRFLGDRIDQIGFLEHDDGRLTIVFVEIKKGTELARARVKPRQAQVRDAIVAGRVVWEVLKVVPTSAGAKCVVDELRRVERVPGPDEPFYPGRPAPPPSRIRLRRAPDGAA